MGWTSYHATHYKNGKVDRKAECDAYFMEGLNRNHFNVLKSSMVGSTYYAAVSPLKRSNGKDDNGNYIYVDIPESEQEVIGVVFLTSTDSKDYYNFSYKNLDETCGPHRYDCPKGILDLLTPTENEYALAWRKACRENLAKKKNPNALSKLPVGTVIKIVMPFDTTYFKAGQEVKLEKYKKYNSNRTQWLVLPYRGIRFTASLMKALEGKHEIIERGDC